MSTTEHTHSSTSDPSQLLAVADLMSLKGRCAIVTGAAQGFGAAIALRLAEAGADVVLADRNEDGVKKKAEEMANIGYSATTQTVDIFNSKQVSAMVNEVAREHQGIDILVNNAGIFSNHYFEKMPVEEFQKTLNVNVVGTFNCTQAVVQEMKAVGKGGSIINIASVDAFKPSAEGLAHYTTTKHAIAGLTRSLAMELGGDNIRVNAVCPGAAMTEGAISLVMAGAPAGIDVEAQWNGIVEKTPLRRLCHPDDVAKAALFLGSEMSSFITGAFLVVDGGILVQPSEGYVPPSGGE
ncbi:MAG: SDR family oxidoreductase [Acidiferrobacteraceae bacterium]|nr:SDR family oxidoreductase [Acidiferrobacteraceae bacterium]